MTKEKEKQVANFAKLIDEVSASLFEIAEKYCKEFEIRFDVKNSHVEIDNEKSSTIIFNWTDCWGGECDTDYINIPIEFFIDYEKAVKEKRDEIARIKKIQEDAEKSRKEEARKKALKRKKEKALEEKQKDLETLARLMEKHKESDIEKLKAKISKQLNGK